MRSARGFAAGFFALLSVASAFGTSVIGTWYGHPDLSKVKQPADIDADRFKLMKAASGKLRVVLTLKAGNAFSAILTGISGQKPLKINGTWSQSGHTISLVGDAILKSVVVSADGTKMVTSPEHSLGAQIVFSRTKPKA